MTGIIPLADLRTSPHAYEFEGGAHGSEVSFILVDCPPGRRAVAAPHPYSETFLVLEGDVLFQVGEKETRVSAGCAVVVPANVPHRFVNIGPAAFVRSIFTAPLGSSPNGSPPTCAFRSLNTHDGRQKKPVRRGDRAPPVVRRIVTRFISARRLSGGQPKETDMA
jgi:quercetin dioxygenase-like cupin family protein